MSSTPSPQTINRTTSTTTVRPHRDTLPQLDASVFLSDGGIETSLIFDQGIDLPDFAAFTLLRDEAGRAALERYYADYVAIAVRDRVGVVLETATWRASADWAARQGIGTEELVELNRRAVELLQPIRRRHESLSTPVVISGCVGPRGDGYRPDQVMSPDESAAYHALQVRTFAGAGVDVVTAITMTSSDEATGVALAARDAGVPVVISFTTETDGRLPTGETLAEAITAVDTATDAAVAYFMVNCAHPTHFDHVLEPGAEWTRRIRGIRANASTMSHAELDEAEELDAGDPVDLAQRYRRLREVHPHITVLGGCCGTNHVHIDALSTVCAAGPGV